VVLSVGIAEVAPSGRRYRSLRPAEGQTGSAEEGKECDRGRRPSPAARVACALRSSPAPPSEAAGRMAFAVQASPGRFLQPSAAPFDTGSRGVALAAGVRKVQPRCRPSERGSQAPRYRPGRLGTARPTRAQGHCLGLSRRPRPPARPRRGQSRSATAGAIRSSSPSRGEPLREGSWLRGPLVRGEAARAVGTRPLRASYG
jgi:hypothetical protein